MAIQNATGVVISVGGTDLVHCTSASLSITRDLRDATTKSSQGWQTNLAGLKSWEVSGDCFVDISDGDVTTHTASLITGSAVAVTFILDDADSTTPDPYTYSGNAVITSVSIDAGVEENATYSITLTGTGALTGAA